MLDGEPDDDQYPNADKRSISEGASAKKARLVDHDGATRELDAKHVAGPMWTTDTRHDEDRELPGLSPLATRIMSPIGHEVLQTFFGLTEPRALAYVDDKLIIDQKRHWSPQLRACSRGA